MEENTENISRLNLLVRRVLRSRTAALVLLALWSLVFLLFISTVDLGFLSLNSDYLEEPKTFYILRYKGQYKLSYKDMEITGPTRINLYNSKVGVRDLKLNYIRVTLGNRNFTSSNSFILPGIHVANNNNRFLYMTEIDLNDFQLLNDNYKFENKQCSIMSTIEEGKNMANENSKILNMSMKSSDCKLDIDINTKSIDMFQVSARVVKFCFFFNLKLLTEIKLFIYQTSDSDSSLTLGKLSLYMLLIHMLADMVEAMFFLFSALSSQYLISSFSIIMLFKLLSIMLIQLRLYLSVWRAQYEVDSSTDFNTFGREATIMLRRLITCVTFVGLILFKLISEFPPLVIILYFSWLPQILRDAWRCQRRSLKWSFILGLSFCRLVLPLYLFSLTPNESIFDGNIYPSVPAAPNYLICVTIVFITLLHLFLYVGQNYINSRFFLPTNWLPKVYNYYRLQSLDKHCMEKGNVILTMEEIKYIDSSECVICMGAIFFKDSTRVVTPCEHFFHENCLKQWIDIKMECPTCRTNLPPFA